MQDKPLFVNRVWLERDRYFYFQKLKKRLEQEKSASEKEKPRENGACKERKK